MKVEDFMKLSPEQIRKAFNKPVGTCAYAGCGKEVRALQSHRVVPAGVYHEDCYFNAFGDEVEAHPIHTPARRGIGGSNLEGELN